MDDAALQQRLDTFERRQSITLSLLVFGYVFLGAWVLVAELDAVSPWVAGFGLVGLAVAAVIVGIYRRRRAR
jgi:hypothetical protein